MIEDLDYKEEKENTNQKDDEYLKFINNITTDEIDNVLNTYEIMGGISLYPGLFSIASGLLIGGIGVGIGGLGVFLGIAGSASFIIGTGGIGLAVIGVGAGLCGIASLFFSHKGKKENDKSSIKSFEKQIKNKDSLESKILDSFNKLLMSHLNHYLNPMILNELNKLIEISNNIKFESSFIVNKLAEKMICKIQERLQNFHELDKFTILVLGKTGVGKTTLINSILNQEQNGTTIGLPMIMENPQILHTNRELFPTLDIWDSRGLELSDEFSIEKNSNQVINFIKNGMKKEGDKKSMNFVHCIWYCVTGARIEKAEIEYIKKLKNIYSSDKKLPIIFVYTKADNDEYIEGIKKTIMMEINDPNLIFVEVISKEISIKYRKQEIVIGKKGLKKLMEESLNLARNGFESAFFGNIYNQYRNVLIHFMSRKPLFDSINKIKEELTKLINEKKSYKKIFFKLPEFLFDSLIFLYFETKSYEANKCQNKKYFDEWGESIINWYKKNSSQFFNCINKDTLILFVEKVIKEYYDKAYEDEISKIPEFEYLSVFHKNAKKASIEESLNSKGDSLKKNFINYTQNIINHKNIFGTYFILDNLIKEFFSGLSKRFESRIMNSLNEMKGKIDKEVQLRAQEIYNNINNGINLNLLPKDDDDEE